MKPWEETVAEINALPEPRRSFEISIVSMIWEGDWNTHLGYYIGQGASSEEIDRLREDYFRRAREQLHEAFGITGYL